MVWWLYCWFSSIHLLLIITFSWFAVLIPVVSLVIHLLQRSPKSSSLVNTHHSGTFMVVSYVFLSGIWSANGLCMIEMNSLTFFPFKKFIHFFLFKIAHLEDHWVGIHCLGKILTPPNSPLSFLSDLWLTSPFKVLKYQQLTFVACLEACMSWL